MLGGWDKDILLTDVLLQVGVGRALLPASLAGELVQPSFHGVAVVVLQGGGVERALLPFQEIAYTLMQKKYFLK